MADPVLAESAHELNRRLRMRYAEVIDFGKLRHLANHRNLSSLFVPAINESYVRSSSRIMIVGRETAGWGKGLKSDFSDFSNMESAAAISTYLKYQMRYHQKKVKEVGARSKFFQFYREAARTVAAPEDRPLENAPAWANLFCFDAEGTRPDRHRDQDCSEIARLSGALLRIQIEVLQPKLIVFATGSSCDSYLKEYFADRVDSKVHIPKRLWEFRLPLPQSGGNSAHAVAFRTPHPRHSATSGARSAILGETMIPGSLGRYLRSTLA